MHFCGSCSSGESKQSIPLQTNMYVSRGCTACGVSSALRPHMPSERSLRFRTHDTHQRRSQKPAEAVPVPPLHCRQSWPGSSRNVRNALFLAHRFTWAGIRSRLSRLWKVGSISSFMKCHMFASVRSSVTVGFWSHASQLRHRKQSLDEQCLLLVWC